MLHTFTDYHIIEILVHQAMEILDVYFRNAVCMSLGLASWTENEHITNSAYNQKKGTVGIYILRSTE